MQTSKKYNTNIYNSVSSIYNNNRKHKIMGAWIILILITMMLYNTLVNNTN